MIDHVFQKLFISGAASVISPQHRLKLRELNITRVLTVSAMPINATDQLPGIKYKFVFMMDMIKQDILGDGLLENALAFIEECFREGSNVLVHCEMGMSRSVTIVCAYLMRRKQWSAEKALLFVEDKRPTVSPLHSFLTQLEIFQKLGYKADVHSLATSALYRNFCADVGIIPKLRYWSDGSEEAASTSGTAPLSPKSSPRATLDAHSPQALAAQHRYKCRKCRTDLFFDTHILRHSLHSTGTSGYPVGSLGQSERCSFEYFVTPMKWMNVEDFQGKIHCPKCGEKLGQYNWGGSKCTGNDSDCGTFVSPWFHLQKSKVDESKLIPNTVNIPSVVIS